MSKVGISDIAIYIPSPKISINTILNARMHEDPKKMRRMQRAVNTTGQKAIRFPDRQEDSVTLAANSAKHLLNANADMNLADLRYMAVGTETSVDMSKPMSAYICGMLQKAGYALPNTISNFQVQHACAGGTIALVSVASLLQTASRSQEKGIVICSDIARYEASSTAEITQGAGATSILVENNPSLVELDLSTQGYSSADVDDFFRPLGTTTARVKGRYSIQCYNTALDEALKDHALRRDKAVADIISETDFFVFHIPFPQMATMSVKRLLHQHIKMNDNEIDVFLNKRCFYSALETTAEVGNIYNAALYLNMATQLSKNYERYGNDIIGKKMLVVSYGSGNIMIVASGTISESAPNRLDRWDIMEQLNHNRQASWEEYEEWMSIEDQGSGTARREALENSLTPNAQQNTFFLEGIREDGYRQYGYKQ